MKFGTLLKHYKIPEFADDYLDYDHLKRQLRTLKFVVVKMCSSGEPIDIINDLQIDGE